MAAAIANSQALVKRTIAFWFQGLEKNQPLPKDCLQLWFFGGAAVDTQIANEFGASVESFLQQDLTEIQQWALNLADNAETVADSVQKQSQQEKKVFEGILTAVLHLDQFTRNMYRGTGRAFSGDATALGLTRWAIEKGLDKTAHPIHRSFLYLPLEHSEALLDQDESVKQFRALRDEYLEDSAYCQILQRFTKYAEEHHEIVVRFGRYPHRNRALDRPSTEEELTFLKEGNNSYGQ